MKVHIVLKTSFFRKYLKDQDFGAVNTTEGTTARELIEPLNIPAHYLNRITVNDQEHPLDKVLTHGDRVVI